jgi:U3 small nucleolar RNA-associated protein 15
MTSFKPSLSLQTQIPSVTSVTLGLEGTKDPSEARYWAYHYNLGGDILPAQKKYATPKSLSFQGPSSFLVNQVLFGPPAFGALSPLAVVSGPRVGLYGTSSTSSLGRALRATTTVSANRTEVAPDRQIGTGGHLALCADYRADGRLLAVGTETGQVRVADTTSRATLITFAGQTNVLPVRTLAWLRNGKQILACGDDGKVRLWSLDTTILDKTQATKTFSGHGDAVRSCRLYETNDQKMAITGSYDHTIRVWNLNEEDDDVACLGIMNHGAPVEALLLMNNESGETPWLLSAGGTQIKVWNFLSGKCHSTLSTMHSKTITAMVCMTRNVEQNQKAWRIITAGLDGLLRIHTWSATKGQLKYIHGVKLSEPITSLAFNETYNRMAIGTTIGQVLLRQEGLDIQSHKRKRDPQAGTYAFFTRGQNVDAKAEDYSVSESKKRKLAAFDVALRQFRYGDALDEALATRQPQSVFAVLEELGRRRGLSIALSNRDEESLEPILSFTVRYITRPQFSSLLIGVSHMLCDIYGNVTGQSEIIDELFGKLQNQIHEELIVQKSLLRLSGMLSALITVQQNEAEDDE